MKTKQLTILILLFVLSFETVNSQTIKRALFIGNSYTDVNNLPLLVSKIASAQGDSLYFDSNVPGGSTLYSHSINALTLSKIAQGNWDFVAVQAQSQEPSFSPTQVATGVLPYAHKLDSLINLADSCAETIFYLTWGRKNGDSFNCANYPPVCTYAGMQSRLRNSYLMMAQQNNASVAPVGAAWREVRNQNPTFDLYQSDESHPSIYGSYLAACVFYSSFFQKPVTSLLYTAGISVADASLIQQQSNATVFDSLQTWYGTGHIPFGSFTIQQHDDTVQFSNTSLNATSYSWYFGDGDSSTAINPQHIYASVGNYPVRLVVRAACKISTYSDTVRITTASVNEIKRKDIFLSFYDATTQEIHIQTKENLTHFKIQLYTVEGKCMLIETAKSTVKVSLKTGIYFLKFLDNYSGKSFTSTFSVY